MKLPLVFMFRALSSVESWPGRGAALASVPLFSHKPPRCKAPGWGLNGRAKGFKSQWLGVEPRLPVSPLFRLTGLSSLSGFGRGSAPDVGSC